MNLDQLRKKRKTRLNVRGKTSVSDYAGIRRIIRIYDRACTRFYGDVDLWTQYLSFTIESKSNKTASKVFARAISLHPRRHELWIMAATYEWEENGDMNAARTLLQRGLRFNKESRELWVAYFKAELLFLVKLMERRKVLGLIPNAASNDKEAAGEKTSEKTSMDTEMSDAKNSDVDPAEKADPTSEKDSLNIALPELEGEEKLTKPPSSDSMSTEQPSDAFFQGAVPKTIVACAFNDIPSDQKLKDMFLQVYETLGAKYECLKDVVESGKKQMDEICDVNVGK